MTEDSVTRAGTAEVDDDCDRIAMLARKATRKASRLAGKTGYSVEYADGVCVVRSPGQSVKIEAKTTPIDVKARYTFAR